MNSQPSWSFIIVTVIMDVSKAVWLNDFRAKKFDYQYDSNNYYNLFI